MCSGIQTTGAIAAADTCNIKTTQVRVRSKGGYMNDLAVIVIPVWAYWFFVGWVALDAVQITIRLVNQFLAWRVSKKEAA
jgi:uncharacterized membrane protein